MSKEADNTFHIDDFKDKQSIWIKSRGELIVENNQFGGSRGFKNGDVRMYEYESVMMLSELLEVHGFFLELEDYKEWKQLTKELNICKCCNQTKQYTSTVITGKELYLIRN